MRRFVHFLLAGLLLAALAAGCTAPPAAEAPAAPTEAAVEAPAAPEAGVAMAAAPEAENAIAPCATTHEGETIVVYQQAGLTGPLSTILGNSFINGTNDAVEEINGAGGVCGAELSIRLVDTQYDPEQELAAYESFRAEDPKPLFVLTYGSGATIVLKDRVNEDKIPNLAAGLNAEAFYIPRNGYTVGVAPIYSDQFAGFVKWAAENWAEIKPEGAGDEIVVGVVGWANAFGAGATTPEALAYAESLGVTVLPLEQQEISPSADVTGQLQNLLVNGANVIYIQSLSFGPAQVIGTLRALGAWDSVVVGGVNWAMNQDVLNILGENATLAEGMYGVVPSYWWTDTEVAGVQKALAAFEAGGYPETEKAVGYLLSYGSLFAIRDILQHAINTSGYENLSGESFMAAMQDLGLVSAGGLYALDVRGENRAPAVATIRRVATVDGKLTYVTVQDFFELPDTRPPAP
ncbi:MAG: ABC transporter substrate-binding protein [Caldilineaceae bacterium]|nr:ABC transporter substrate-binding protein [Caldilineaceae bacterium]